MRRFSVFVAGGLVLAALVGYGSWQLSQPKTHMAEESSAVQAGYATTSTTTSVSSASPSRESEPESSTELTTTPPLVDGNASAQASGAHDLYLPPGTPDLTDKPNGAHPTRWAPAPPQPGQSSQPNFPHLPPAFPRPAPKPAPNDDDDDPWLPIPSPDDFYPDSPESTTETTTESSEGTPEPTTTTEPVAPPEPVTPVDPVKPIEPRQAKPKPTTSAPNPQPTPLELTTPSTAQKAERTPKGEGTSPTES